jgi:hypothetical protein
VGDITLKGLMNAALWYHHNGFILPGRGSVMELSCPFMVRNVGTADRCVRIVAGLLLAGAGLAGFVPSPWHYLAILAGFILLVTGIAGRCPAYTLLGFSTLKKK